MRHLDFVDVALAFVGVAFGTMLFSISWVLIMRVK